MKTKVIKRSSGVTELLDDIQAILDRDKISVAELARDLGYSKLANDSGYLQVYNWLVVRRYKPKGEAVLKLSKWRDQHQKRKRK
jgi:hypothetical protein